MHAKDTKIHKELKASRGQEQGARLQLLLDVCCCCFRVGESVGLYERLLLNTAATTAANQRAA
jgi:hypothetical protein